MASTMYCLPPIIDSSVKVRLPTCMYRMDPINRIEASNKPGNETMEQSSVDNVSELATLENRQEQLLERLANLRALVQATQQHLGVSNSTTGTAVSTAVPVDIGEIVVQANPSAPPYSVLCLRSLVGNLGCSSHVHSSQSAVDDQLVRTLNWRAAAEPSITVRIIWQPVGETRLLVTPSGQACPLAGEEQLVRYVARTLLPGQYEDAGLEQAALVDQFLDVAEVLRLGAGKERQAALQSLQSRLLGNKFILGESPTLVDAAVWSALRSSGLKTPPAITAWTDRMNVIAKQDRNCSAVISAASTSTEPKLGASSTKRTGGIKESSVINNKKPTMAKPSQQKTGDSSTKVAASHAHSERPLKAATSAPDNSSPPQHKTEQGLLLYLKRRDIEAETVRHPPVMTVEEMLPHLKGIAGGITKNLFLRDKKKQLYVLTALHDKEFQLKDVAAQVPGAKELRFGDEAALWDLLGVRSGCVTPLALINDRERRVKLLLDVALLDGTFTRVWFHPLTNAATTGISPADLSRFLTAIDHQPILLKL